MRYCLKIPTILRIAIVAPYSLFYFVQCSFITKAHRSQNSNTNFHCTDTDTHIMIIWIWSNRPFSSNFYQFHSCPSTYNKQSAFIVLSSTPRKSLVQCRLTNGMNSRNNHQPVSFFLINFGVVHSFIAVDNPIWHRRFVKSLFDIAGKQCLLVTANQNRFYKTLHRIRVSHTILICGQYVSTAHFRYCSYSEMTSTFSTIIWHGLIWNRVSTSVIRFSISLFIIMGWLCDYIYDHNIIYNYKYTRL